MMQKIINQFDIAVDADDQLCNSYAPNPKKNEKISDSKSTSNHTYSGN